jgi:hypothetical protein
MAARCSSATSIGRDLPLSTQVKLLRVLPRARDSRRVGSRKAIPIDVRLNSPPPTSIWPTRFVSDAFCS